jgi:hypothetical protein
VLVAQRCGAGGDEVADVVRYCSRNGAVGYVEWREERSEVTVLVWTHSVEDAGAVSAFTLGTENPAQVRGRQNMVASPQRQSRHTHRGHRVNRV